MAINLNNYMIKAQEFMQKASGAMNVTHDKEVAGRIVRAVFHTLRDQLSTKENLQLLAQLPIVMKGVYVDGWSATGTGKRINHLSDFLEEVRSKLGDFAGHDLGNDSMARERISGVFEALHHYVSEGEMDDVCAQLPNEVKELVLEAKPSQPA